MSVMDFLSQGGGPPGSGEGGQPGMPMGMPPGGPEGMAPGPEGMPPELMALLGGGGEPPMGEPPMEEPPAEEEPQDESEEYRSIIDHIRSVQELPTVDDIEAAQLEKAIAIFASLLAKNQQMNDQATGANPSLRKGLARQGF